MWPWPYNYRVKLNWLIKVHFVIKPIIDIRLRPRTTLSPIRWVSLSIHRGNKSVLLPCESLWDYTVFALPAPHRHRYGESMLTSSKKPEVHNVSRHRRRRTEPRSHNNLANLDTWFLRYAGGQTAHTQRETDRQNAHYSTLIPYRTPTHNRSITSPGPLKLPVAHKWDCFDSVGCHVTMRWTTQSDECCACGVYWITWGTLDAYRE